MTYEEYLYAKDQAQSSEEMIDAAIEYYECPAEHKKLLGRIFKTLPMKSGDKIELFAVDARVACQECRDKKDKYWMDEE